MSQRTESLNNESRLGRLEARLAQLAQGLEPLDAQVELNLKGELLEALRKMFLAAQERDFVLSSYREIHGTAELDALASELGAA